MGDEHYKETNVLRELISHPIASIRFIVKRLAQIPRLGLPNFDIGRRDDFDRKLGIETAVLVRVVETDSKNQIHGRGYQVSDVRTVEWALASSGVVFERTTFVDIGCGKGRVLILASRKPFKRIIGIDYSQNLLNICGRNLKHLGLETRCETYLHDAASFPFPEGELMLLLYNPFDSPLFETVLERIREINAPVTLAYLGPERESLECQWLREIGRFGSGRLYRNLHGRP